ncbi:MAG: globin-coupled sensor protein, partial [Rhodospirillales bacterium]|nr:globin-coupled sensor protein [Rhodospirillales bacterium]
MPLDATAATEAATDHDRDARLGFLRLDAATGARLAALRPEIAAALPAIAAQFYAHLGSIPPLAALLGGAERIARLTRSQTAHWDHLFSGRFDTGYFARAIGVGKVHERIGLEPRWYLGGYCLILERLAAHLASKHGARPALAEDLAALLRAAFLDMDLAVSAYVTHDGESKVREEVLAVSDILEREMQIAASEIAAQAEQLAEGAGTLGGVATGARAHAEEVRQATEGTVANVQTVASATTELEASAREIANQVARAAETAAATVRRTEEAGQTMRGLATAS